MWVVRVVLEVECGGVERRRRGHEEPTMQWPMRMRRSQDKLAKEQAHLPNPRPVWADH